MTTDETELRRLQAELAEERALAADATEYRVLLPEGGGQELRVSRQTAAFGTGWAVCAPRRGGGVAWTREGWQESISALSVDRLFCWPDARTAIEEARRELAPDGSAPSASGDVAPVTAPGTPTFFEAEVVYDSQDGYTAPEDSLRFDCKHVTRTPEGQLIAFGFVRVGAKDRWTPTGFGTDDWTGKPWRAVARSR
ncbi:hypothetical protein [Streptomyces sp. GSL17-111]|uniref:hypothetical protein n=1 Tax=Streptomyces sp. GSL17-111 TaxID=3121596 RepID=UPI0030F37086